MSTTRVSSGELSRGHLITFQVLSVVVALAAWLGLGGIFALLFGWGGQDEALIHRVHDVQWGALMGIAVPVAVLSQIRRPSDHIASLQLVASVALAFLVAGLAMGRAEDLPFVAIIVVTLVALLAIDPARRSLRDHGRVSRLLAALTVATGLPLAWFAVTNIIDERSITATDPHAGHFVGSAIMAVVIVSAGIITTYRASGWRVTGWLTGIMLAVTGLVSILNPDLASSLGRVWGTIAIVGGAAFAAATEMEHRATEG